MPVAISTSSKEGFTLVEVLVAMVILVVGMLGLLQSINVVLQTNLGNQLRDEAVNVAEEHLATAKRLPFDAITSAPNKQFAMRRNMKNIFKNYTVTKSVISAGSSSKQIQIRVSWLLKGIRSEHHVVSMVSKYD